MNYSYQNIFVQSSDAGFWKCKKRSRLKKKINRVTYTFIVKISRRGNNEASQFWVGVQVIEGDTKKWIKREMWVEMNGLGVHGTSELQPGIPLIYLCRITFSQSDTHGLLTAGRVVRSQTCSHSQEAPRLNTWCLHVRRTQYVRDYTCGNRSALGARAAEASEKAWEWDLAVRYEEESETRG